MKVLITLSMEVPNVDNIDEADEFIRKWMAESDYVMRQRHYNERFVPNDPCIYEVKEIKK